MRPRCFSDVLCEVHEFAWWKRKDEILKEQKQNVLVNVDNVRN